MTVPHFDSAEFRRRGHEVVDWIAQYFEDLESRPVRSQVEPGAVRSALPESPPESGEPFEDVLADVERVLVPGLTHWQHPSFFAYFPANSSGPSILGELLSAGLGVQGMLWQTSPAATELETLVCDWFVELLGLPERFASTGTGGAVIQDTASSASLCALLAARERASGGAARQRGVREEFVVYTTSEAHSSIEKAAIIAGLGEASVRSVETTDALAMKPGALDAAIEADRAAGRVPCAIFATVGTTSTTAIDPVEEIGQVAQKHGVWLHVDAAYAGAAMVCPEFREHQRGLERADSYCWNPHKWLLTNFDCDLFHVADRAALVSALSILPEYLRNDATGSGKVIDYRDWQIPLGRRFRALKLWMVVRHYGAEGMRAYIREHCEWALEFASWVDESAEFERVGEVPFSLVCFAHTSGDEFSEALLERLNASGDLYLSHTKVGGRYTLRLAIGAVATRRKHVVGAWERIVTEAKALATAGPSSGD